MGVRGSRNCKTPSPSPDKTRCLSGGVSTFPPSAVLGSDSLTCPPCLPAFMLEEDGEGLSSQELAAQMATGRPQRHSLGRASWPGWECGWRGWNPAGPRACLGLPQGAETRHGTHVLGATGM